MKKLFLIPLLALALSMESCIDMEKITFEEIERVNVNSANLTLTEVDIAVWVDNASGSNVHVKDIQATIYNGDKPLMDISLQDKVVIPRNKHNEIAVVVFPVSAKFSGPMGALAALSIPSNPEKIMISGEVILRAGLMKKTFQIEKMTLRQFSETYGVDLNQMIKNAL